MPEPCATHHPPRPGREPRQADPPHLICADCLNRLHRLLSATARDDDGRHVGIPALWCQLDTRPVRGEPGRKGPGFGSRSPARDHVISMRDPRGGELGLRSVPAVLADWCQLVADECGVRTPQRRDVPDLAEMLGRSLDWLAQQDYIEDLHAELRDLASQLRSAVGDPKPRPVARCIAQFDGVECGAPIYMPPGTPRALDEPIADLPQLDCRACGADYRGAAIIRLRLANERSVA